MDESMGQYRTIDSDKSALPNVRGLMNIQNTNASYQPAEEIISDTDRGHKKNSKRKIVQDDEIRIIGESKDGHLDLDAAEEYASSRRGGNDSYDFRQSYEYKPNHQSRSNLGAENRGLRLDDFADDAQEELLNGDTI